MQIVMPPDVEEWLISRAENRHARLRDRLDSIHAMRQMPDASDVSIGSAKDTRAVVLFADLVRSTQHAMAYAAEPEKMLATLNILIPTLQDCASRYEGQFEKNTGDGILAYFGVEASVTDEIAVKRAVFAGHAMQWALTNIVNPALTARKLRPVQITIGADLGNVLIARIGVAYGPSPFVAVGVVANRAAKIQDRCQPNQFRVGEDFYNATGRDIRALFSVVAIPPDWPFKTPKPKFAYVEEQRRAREAADADTERRRQEWSLRNRTVGLPFMPAFITATPPEYVDPNRPYGVYLYKGYGYTGG